MLFDPRARMLGDFPRVWCGTRAAMRVTSPTESFHRLRSCHPDFKSRLLVHRPLCRQTRSMADPDCTEISAWLSWHSTSASLSDSIHKSFGKSAVHLVPMCRVPILWGQQRTN